jgi:16S rRNA (cytosine967-C5)-methyltransferase
MSTTDESVSPARYLALEQLERVAHDDAFVERLVSDDADDRARRQARDLLAGVTRQRRWLDFVLGEAYNDDYDSMESRLRHILRLGLYEMLFQSTPTRAVVHQYVELAKQTLRPGAGNLVNAILRTIDRDREHIPNPDTGDEAEDLAIRYSHPTWMVRRWVERYGIDEALDLLEWNNRRPMYSVRINPLRASHDEVEAWLDEQSVVFVDSPYLDDYLRLKRLQPLVQEGLLDDGHVAVQDESAGLIVQLLDPQPGDTIVDGCAAPGGKTMAIAARLQGEGRIHAIDAKEERVELVREAAEAQGASEIVDTEAEELQAVAVRPDVPQADRVLLDVPCSGLGVLAKRADLRWQRAPEDFDDLTALQDDLLDAAAGMVAPGGLLVYSTCTIEPEENEARVEAFLARHDDFEREAADEYVPEDVVSAKGALTTLPHRHRTDGAFAVRLRRVTS